MKIIKKGDINIATATITFNCPTCFAMFEASRGEWTKTSSTQPSSNMVMCKSYCPCCGECVRRIIKDIL